MNWSVAETKICEKKNIQDQRFQFEQNICAPCHQVNNNWRPAKSLCKWDFRSRLINIFIFIFLSKSINVLYQQFSSTRYGLRMKNHSIIFDVERVSSSTLYGQYTIVPNEVQVYRFFFISTDAERSRSLNDFKCLLCMCVAVSLK